MCGFFGIWSRDGAPVNLESLQNATQALVHRGPDDEGYLLINTQTGRVVPCTGQDTCADVRGLPLSAFQGQHFDLALGFRRLSILDRSAAGHQPMGTPDGSNWIVFNGEVYNYIELRDELQREGTSFETGTDTEVALAAYRRWGAECLQKFNGMWAFAVWNNRRVSCSLHGIDLGLNRSISPVRRTIGSFLRQKLRQYWPAVMFRFARATRQYRPT